MAGELIVEKMQHILDSLEAHPEVVIGKQAELCGLKTDEWPEPRWRKPAQILAHNLNIPVHPRTPMYGAEELNAFMLGIIPGLEASSVDRFRGDDRGLRLGRLRFTESIGKATMSATVKLNDGISLVGKQVLKPEWAIDETLDLVQRTWVSVFPDANHLADALRDHNVQYIPRHELGRATAAGRSGLRHLLKHTVTARS